MDDIYDDWVTHQSVQEAYGEACSPFDEYFIDYVRALRMTCELRDSKPTVPEVLPLVRGYYSAGNPTGGSLHIVLDDRNVETPHVEFCVGYAVKHHDATGQALATLLLEMSAHQRYHLAAWWERRHERERKAAIAHG